MRRIMLDKVVLHINVGNRIERLEKAKILLERITGRKPALVKAKKKVPAWEIRPGKPIGYKVTLRGEDARRILKLMFETVDNKVKEEWFDEYGNLSFGIKEYIDIPGMKYDPELGIMGLDVCVSFKRPGYRIAERRIARRRIPKRHRITKEEVIEFLKREFNVEIV